MTTLFFEPHITGHRQEFLNHLIDYIAENQIPGNFIFVVHPDFVTTCSQPLATHRTHITIEALSSPRRRGQLHAAWSVPGLLFRSLSTYRLASRFARLHSADQLCFLNFNDVQFALGLIRPKYSVSGILFKPFARQEKESFRQKLTWLRKYFQTWLFVRNRRIKNLFILNDQSSAEYLNKAFHTGIFQMLPDPVQILTPEPGFDVRKHFGISPKRKLFLHIGSLLKRKGTLDLLDSLKYLTEDERSRFTLLIIGYSTPEMDTEIRKRIPPTSNQQPATSIQQPATSNRQPATSNQQPATSIQQPATSIHYLNSFVPPPVFKSFLNQCDFVLVPYRYPESSSGIAGHAFAAGKPLLAVRKGLLGEMIAEYGTGVFIEEPGPGNIAVGIQAALAGGLNGKSSESFVQTHSAKAFAEKLVGSIHQ